MLFKIWCFIKRSSNTFFVSVTWFEYYCVLGMRTLFCSRFSSSRQKSSRPCSKGLPLTLWPSTKRCWSTFWQSEPYHALRHIWVASVDDQVCMMMFGTHLHAYVSRLLTVTHSIPFLFRVYSSCGSRSQTVRYHIHTSCQYCLVDQFGQIQ